MLDKLSLESISEVDCQGMQTVKFLASSFDKLYQVIFEGVINFTYSIEADSDLSGNEFDIIFIEYSNSFPKKEMLKYYSYDSDKSLYKKKLHYLLMYGDLELIIISKELYIKEMGNLSIKK